MQNMEREVMSTAQRLLATNVVRALAAGLVLVGDKTPELKHDNATRIEPINTTYSIEESLQARVKDPLWMLGRSWQLGEFQTQNGGHPVRIEISHKSELMDNLYNQDTGQVQGIEIDKPLEMIVEEEGGGLVKKPPLWNTRKLGYEFKLVNDNTDDDDEPLDDSIRIVLRADDYSGRNLDWYDFTVVQKGAITSDVIDAAFYPNQIDVPGLPHKKWWRLEDSRIDVGNIQRYYESYITMLLMNFGLYSSSDWYIQSLDQLIGSIREITRFEIMDSFGVISTVSPVSDQTANKKGWEIFTLSDYYQEGSAGNFFFLPNSISLRSLKSDPLEDVDFTRDELANLVWAIEKKYQEEPGLINPGGFGGIIHNRNDEIQIPVVEWFKHYFGIEDSELKDTYEGVGEPGYNFLGPLANFRLKSFVPENWLPYMAYIVGEFLSGDIVLRRARTMEDKTPADPQYKGVILFESIDINEEEISRAGVRVTRNWQIARDLAGEMVSWLGRQNVRVELHKSSGLQFDFLEDE